MGLIHQLIGNRSPSNMAIVLQAINTHVFKNPADIVYNYSLVYHFLNRQEAGFGARSVVFN